jgi:four helix bundle protein
MKSFRDLRVWEQAIDLVEVIYRHTEDFPRHELYGLTNQLRRASVSVPSNIAEGKGLQTDKEFCAFLYRARGSLMEIQTQVIIAKRLQYLDEPRMNHLLQRCEQVGRSLAGLINAISETAHPAKAASAAGASKGTTSKSSGSRSAPTTNDQRPTTPRPGNKRYV